MLVTRLTFAQHKRQHDQRKGRQPLYLANNKRRGQEDKRDDDLEHLQGGHDSGLEDGYDAIYRRQIEAPVEGINQLGRGQLHMYAYDMLATFPVQKNPCKRRVRRSVRDHRSTTDDSLRAPSTRISTRDTRPKTEGPDADSRVFPKPLLCRIHLRASTFQIHPAEKHGGEVVQEKRFPRSAEQHEVGSECEAEEKNPFERILTWFQANRQQSRCGDDCHPIRCQFPRQA